MLEQTDLQLSGGSGGGGGAGTEYTEDAAAPANPIGPIVNLRRRDTLSAAEVSADGDVITANATSKGETYTHDTDLLAAVAGVAHDAADTTNPASIGAHAAADLSSRTLVSLDDLTRLFADLSGRLITCPQAPLSDATDGNASNTDGTPTQCIAASGSASIYIHLTSIILTNMSASNIYVEIKCGSTVRATLPLPANSGCVFNPPVPLKASAANAAWNFDPSAAAATVYCTMIGFKSKVT